MRLKGKYDFGSGPMERVEPEVRSFDFQRCHILGRERENKTLLCCRVLAWKTEIITVCPPYFLLEGGYKVITIPKIMSSTYNVSDPVFSVFTLNFSEQPHCRGTGIPIL